MSKPEKQTTREARDALRPARELRALRLLDNKKREGPKERVEEET